MSEIPQKLRPPEGDIGCVCHDSFALSTQANYCHWFCAECILRAWHHSSALVPCKCPICLISLPSHPPPCLAVVCYAPTQLPHAFYTAECILRVWHHSSALVPCKCPICRRTITLLLPSHSVEASPPTHTATHPLPSPEPQPSAPSLDDQLRESSRPSPSSGRCLDQRPSPSDPSKPSLADPPRPSSEQQTESQRAFPSEPVENQQRESLRPSPSSSEQQQEPQQEEGYRQQQQPELAAGEARNSNIAGAAAPEPSDSDRLSDGALPLSPEHSLELLREVARYNRLFGGVPVSLWQLLREVARYNRLFGGVPVSLWQHSVELLREVARYNRLFGGVPVSLWQVNWEVARYNRLFGGAPVSLWQPILGTPLLLSRLARNLSDPLRALLMAVTNSLPLPLSTPSHHSQHLLISFPSIPTPRHHSAAHPGHAAASLSTRSGPDRPAKGPPFAAQRANGVLYDLLLLLLCLAFHLSLVYCDPVLFLTVLFLTVLFLTVLFLTVLFLTVLFLTVLFLPVLFLPVLFLTVLFLTVLFLTVLFLTVLFLTTTCFSSSALSNATLLTYVSALSHAFSPPCSPSAPSFPPVAMGIVGLLDDFLLLLCLAFYLSLIYRHAVLAAASVLPAAPVRSIPFTRLFATRDDAGAVHGGEGGGARWRVASVLPAAPARSIPFTRLFATRDGASGGGQRHEGGSEGGGGQRHEGGLEGGGRVWRGGGGESVFGNVMAYGDDAGGLRWGMNL
ncbi:unnamed protein product [Closterium sp. Naga37s-1]|nr:unnamed protein product [Closterium sp. Naga37s-1]